MSYRAVVVDSGSANINSICTALKKASVDFIVSDNPAIITAAGGVIFPGVGAFDHAMIRLNEKNLHDPLLRFIGEGRPFLGICLGLQLLFTDSEEVHVFGSSPSRGLNVIPGRVRRFPGGLPVPHVGWNMARPERSHPLFEGLERGAYFYYTHSYYVEPSSAADSLALTGYGLPFCAAAARDRLMGVQFHPEKSGPAGLRLLNNFGKIIAEPRIF